MVISYIGASSASNGLATGSTLTLSVPAGTANGDYMLAFVAIRDEAQTITPPGGWTQVTVAVNETDHEFRVYERTASSEPASYNWALGGNTAFTGHMRVYRGVGFRRAQTETDLLNVLAHTGPSLVGGPGSWRIVTESAQSLLSVGWAPPGGFVAEVDTIGGLLILLNVNMMTAHAGPSVSGGTFQETSTSLDLITAINGLIVLEPLLSPLVATPVDGKGIVPAPVMVRTLLPGPVDGRVVIQGGVAGLGAEVPPIPGSVIFGAPAVGLGILDVQPIDDKALLGLPAVGYVITPEPLDLPHLHVSGAIIPGEVTLVAPVLDGFVGVADDVQIVPGEAIIGGWPLLTSSDVQEGVLTPGEITTSVDAFDTFVHVGPSGGEIVLGNLLSSIVPVDGKLTGTVITIGLRIGPFGFVPFIYPDPNAVTTFGTFKQGTVWNTPVKEPCC